MAARPQKPWPITHRLFSLLSAQVSATACVAFKLNPDPSKKSEELQVNLVPTMTKGNNSPGKPWLAYNNSNHHDDSAGYLDILAEQIHDKASSNATSVGTATTVDMSPLGPQDGNYEADSRSEYTRDLELGHEVILLNATVHPDLLIKVQQTDRAVVFRITGKHYQAIVPVRIALQDSRLGTAVLNPLETEERALNSFKFLWNESVDRVYKLCYLRAVWDLVDNGGQNSGQPLYQAFLNFQIKRVPS